MVGEAELAVVRNLEIGRRWRDCQVSAAGWPAVNNPLIGLIDWVFLYAVLVA